MSQITALPNYIFILLINAKTSTLQNVFDGTLRLLEVGAWVGWSGGAGWGSERRGRLQLPVSLETEPPSKVGFCSFQTGFLGGDNDMHNHPVLNILPIIFPFLYHS